MITHAPGSNQASNKLRWSAEATAGFEYDSNATRLDSTSSSEEEPLSSGLFRGRGRLTLTYRPAQGLVLATSYDLAGKVFFQEEARSQDTVIQRLTAAVGIRLGPRVLAKIGGLYHEGFQREPDRDTVSAGLFDFRVLDGRAQLVLLAGPGLTGSLAVGAHRFTYKPSEFLSFDAILTAVTLDSHHTLGKGDKESELDLALSYSLSRRQFGAEFELLCGGHIPGCEPPEPGQLVTYTYPGSKRRDLVHHLTLELTWVRGMLLQAVYQLGVSHSNSYGLGYTLHDLKARLVTPLFLKIYGTLQVKARFLNYTAGSVPHLYSGFEEENRSHVLLQLERNVVDRLSLVLRYTLFVGELTSPDVADLRHLVYLGCAYRYGSK